MFSKPGKTAPRLIEDLYNYDARLRARCGRNILTDAPPHFDESKPPMSAVPGGSCRHNLMMKPDQCVLPAAWEEHVKKGAVYKIASYCPNCRYHVSVVVDFREESCSWLCPNEEYKLHHFLHVPGVVRGDAAQDGRPTESHRFQCSAEQCGAVVTIEIAPPRLSVEDMKLLSDKRVLEKRLQSAMRIDPTRPDLQAARPVDGYYILHAYIRDALAGKAASSRIPLRNRKFLVTYGEDCDELLERLGFTRKTDGSDDGSWFLPVPVQDWDRLQGDTLRDHLDDTMQELMSLIDRMPSTSKLDLKKFAYEPRLSRGAIEQALGSFNYLKKAGYSVATQGSEDHPYYAGLGAVGNFSDDLLAFAYDRQVATDPQNQAYYFECLQDLANGRKSEELDLKRAMEESKGVVSRKDAYFACKYFGIEFAYINDLGDEHIINAFRSRIPDIGAHQVPEARQMLHRIGVYRQSRDILNAASDTIETYEQAISWLGVDDSHSDDQIVAVASSKKTDDSSNEGKIQQAIKIIAEHRKSQSLLHWLQTGEHNVDDPELERARAYSAFNLSDHKGSVDAEMLELTLEASKQSDPHKSAELDRFAAIIRADIAKGSAPQPPPRHPPDQWPVGIENLGNTCYLNAILQFLFTIKPLREFVLNIGDQLMEINEENMSKKRVGSRKVTEDEVRRSQEFVSELKQLFNDLITAPGSTIRPRLELVQRALEYAVADETPRPSETDAALPVTNEAQGSDSQPPSSRTEAGDSDVTLVGDKDQEILPDASDASTGEEAATTGDESSKNIPPPDHPPPVPPRNQNNTPARIPHTMQQDASEILINILLQLSYAIRPDHFGNDGEQVDFVKDLFYGQERVFLSRNGATTEQTSLYNTQYVTVVDKPKNIYEAIDDALDKGAIEGSDDTEKWTTMLKVPPILKIDVKRLGFDKEKKQTIRSEHHLGLEETIYIDRYLHNEAVLQRRKISWEKKARLRSLLERRDRFFSTKLDTPMPDVLLAASEYVSSLEGNAPGESADALVDEMFHDGLKAKAAEIQEEINGLNETIIVAEKEISSLFADMTSVPYKLHSLFIHRGGTGGGHYLVSIRDFKNDMWRNYNDETITEVSDIEKNVFGQGDTYSKIITTCIVYVRADLKFGDQDLVEAIHRKPTQPADVEMTNFSELPVTEGVDVPSAAPAGGTNAEADPPAYDDAGYDTKNLDLRPSDGRW